MLTLPTLSELHPTRWVETMRRVRAEVAERAADVLDRYTHPVDARPQLQPIFDRFTQIDINTPAISRLEAALSVEVQAHDEALVFWIFPTRQYQSMVFTGAGHWWFNHQSESPSGLTNHQLHRQLIEHLLTMLPWASDDGLAEIAAIEVASRAG